MEQTAATIADWLRDYTRAAGAGGYVVGLSGGVDSAVTAALCVQAVGGDNVVLAKLPCRSHYLDGVLADEVADWLGVPIETVNLEPVFKRLLEQLVPFLVPLIGGPIPSLVSGNVKARLRMTTLYAIANARGYLVAGTGNRTELELGYFTKYGDGGVDVLPLGDLYKTEVWALARHLGVPSEVIERPPSAGLWPGQTDEGELGASYADLDRALQQMYATGTTAGVEPALAHRVHRATHKLNIPPVCLLGEVR